MALTRRITGSTGSTGTYNSGYQDTSLVPIPLPTTPGDGIIPTVGSFGPSTIHQSRGISTFTRNSVVTPGGIKLPLTQYIDNDVAYYRETGQAVSSANFNGLATYVSPNFWGTGSGFARTTTGNYVPTSNFLGKGAPKTPGDVQISFNEQAFKSVLLNPIAKEVFKSGNLTDLYYIQTQGITQGLKEIAQHKASEASRARLAPVRAIAQQKATRLLSQGKLTAANLAPYSPYYKPTAYTQSLRYF